MMKYHFEEGVNMIEVYKKAHDTLVEIMKIFGVSLDDIKLSRGGKS